MPANETERLVAVRALNILDTAPEIAYDDIGELAAQICQCPVAYVSLMDDDRLWLKAKYGLPPNFNQCPREIAFCATTVCGTEMVVAPDLLMDSRFNQIPFVTGEPHFKFYCGIPLVTEAGYALGTLCVMDFEPRQLAFEQAESLRRLSRQVLTQLELRRKLIELDQTLKELDHAHVDLVAEKARTEELLINILPVSIADELKKSGKVQPKYEPSATILFADFKGFTLLAERMEPAALIGLLDWSHEGLSRPSTGACSNVLPQPAEAGVFARCGWPHAKRTCHRMQPTAQRLSRLGRERAESGLGRNGWCSNTGSPVLWRRVDAPCEREPQASRDPGCRRGRVQPAGERG
jgi:hypothetical protein